MIDVAVGYSAGDFFADFFTGGMYSGIRAASGTNPLTGDSFNPPARPEMLDPTKRADYLRAAERGKRAEEARAAAQQQLAELRKAPRTSNYTPIQATMPSFTLGAEED